MSNAAVVSIGTFDGVHVGHQAILNEVRSQASKRRIPAVAYAFALPPRMQAAQHAERGLLLPRSVKDQLLLRTIDRVVHASLSEVRDLSPSRFAEVVLSDQLHAESVVIGGSFRFGAQRAGDTATLRSLGKQHGFSVTVVPPILVGGTPASSTRIRSLLSAGDVPGATALLGRAPVLIGDVVRGDQIGQTLGYATANLALDPRVLLPHFGVYVVHAFIGEQTDSAGKPALLYIGMRPTLGTQEGVPRCEVHLLSESDVDLYGRRIEIHMLKHLRGDQRFATLADLRHQIDQDVERASAFLSGTLCRPAPISG